MGGTRGGVDGRAVTRGRLGAKKQQIKIKEKEDRECGMDEMDEMEMEME